MKQTIIYLHLITLKPDINICFFYPFHKSLPIGLNPLIGLSLLSCVPTEHLFSLGKIEVVHKLTNKHIIRKS